MYRLFRHLNRYYSSFSNNFVESIFLRCLLRAQSGSGWQVETKTIKDLVSKKQNQNFVFQFLFAEMEIKIRIENKIVMWNHPFLIKIFMTQVFNKFHICILIPANCQLHIRPHLQLFVNSYKSIYQMITLSNQNQNLKP